jgi:PKD repeat protein
VNQLYSLAWLAVWLLSAAGLYGQTCNINVAPGTTFCANTDLSFSATSSLDTSAIYTWNFGDGSPTATGETTQHNYGFNTATQTYTVTLTVTDSTDTCVVTQMVTALYQPQITLNNANVFTNYCIDDSNCNTGYTLPYSITTSASGPYIWNWNDGNPPDTTTGLSNNHLFTNYGTNTLTITALGSTCPSIITPINFYTEPEAPDFTLPITNFCEGDLVSINFTHNACPNNISYYLIYWDFNNPQPGNIDTVYSPGPYSHVYTYDDSTVCNPPNLTQTGQVKSIYVFAINPCYGSDPSLYTNWVNKGVSIAYAPHPDFGFSPQPPCWPDDSVITFTNNSCLDIPFTPNVLTYAWDFGDLTTVNDTSSSKSPFYTYPGPGLYNVSLTATNATCGARTISYPLQILEFPFASAQLSDTTGCAPLTVSTVNSSGPGNIAYQWQVFPNNGVNISAANQATPDLVFNQPGRYLVQLTVSNPCGNEVWSDSVIVTDVPEVNVALLDDTCDIVTYLPSATVDANECAITSYAWDFGPNAVPQTATTANPGAVLFNPGAHTVSLTVTNCCGTSTDQVSFTVYSAALVSGGDDSTLCADNPNVCLIATPPGGTWTFLGLSDTTGCFILPGVGSYLIDYRYDTLGCSFQDSVWIEVVPLPTVDAGGPLDTCRFDTLLLSGATPANGTWTGFGLLNDSLFVSDSVGVFTLTYTYADSNGCEASDTRQVTVHDLPTLNAGPNDTFCLVNAPQGLPTPTATPAGGTFTWSGPGITNPSTGSFNPSLAGQGTHPIYVDYLDPNGCETFDSLLVTVLPPSVPVTSTSDSSLCQNAAPVTLVGTPAGNWSGAAGFVAPDQFDPAGLPGGSYPMVYTILAGSSCEASDTLIIQVLDTAVVFAGQDTLICASEASYLPSSFSPAGGQWSGLGVIDPITGEVDLTQLAIGSNATLTYTYLDPGSGCVSRDAYVLTRQPLPTVVLPADTLYCYTPDTVQLPTPLSSGNGGLWSGSVGIVDPVLGLFNPDLVGIDTVTLVYCDNDGLCDACDSMLVYIRAAEPAFTNQADTAICVDQPPLSLSGGLPLGGQWSGPGVVNGPGGSVFDPSLAGVGAYDLLYCFGVGSCERCDTTRITVNPLPIVDAGSLADVCEGDAPFYLPPGTPTAPGAFTWSGPNVVQVAPDSFFFDPATPNTYTLTYTYTDPNGCTNADSLVLTVNPLPVVDAGLDTVYCFTPDTQQLPGVTVAPIGGTGTWSGPGVVDAVNGLFLPSLVDTGVYQISYCYSDPLTCARCDTVLVTVIRPDSLSAGPDDTVCLNEPPYLLPDAYPAMGGTWSGAGIVNPATGLYEASQAGVGVDTVIYRLGFGSCEVLDTVLITVQPLPLVTAQPDSMCITDPPLLLVTGLAFGVQPASPNTWSWSGPGVDTLTPTSYQFDPNLLPVGTQVGPQPVVFTYRDSVNTIGCTVSDTTFIRVDSLPQANFAPPASFCIGDSVCPNNLSTDAVSYVWDFGAANANPLTATAVNPCVVYPDTGTYVITLIATAATGCSDTFSQTVFISEPPVPVFGLAPDSGCAVIDILPGITALEVLLSDSSNAAGGSYFWDFGGGVTATGDSNSTAINPPPVYFPSDDSTRVYYVTLSLVNFCDSVSYVDSVVVKPIPAVNFDAQFGVFCSPYTPVWYNTTVGEPDSFFWYLDVISPATLVSTDSAPSNITLTYNGQTDTTYYLYLIAKNECGADTARDSIRVLPNTVDAAFSIDQTFGCGPLTVMLSSFANAPNLGWDMGDGTTYGSVTSVVHTFTQADTFVIQHFADNGCSYDTNTVQVIVFPDPDIGVIPEDTTVCAFEPITWIDTTGTTNSIGYNWHFGDGATSNATSPTHAYSQGGSYEVIVNVVSTLNGCPASDTVTVTVLPPPPVSFTTPDTIGCVPFPAAFTNTSGAGISSYFWEFGDGQTSALANPSHTYAAPGVYFVRLRGFNAAGCSGRDTQRVVVLPVPTADYSYDLPDSCLLAGQSLVATFTNLSTDTAVSYAWDFGDGGTSTLRHPTHAFAAPDTYQVTLVVTSAVGGCADTATQTLIIYPQPAIQLAIDQDEGCEVLPVTLTHSTDPSTFTQALWDFGDGNDTSLLGSTVPHRYVAPTGDTSYTLTLTVDFAGKCVDQASLTVEVFSQPTAALAIDPDSVCGAPAPIDFADQSSDFTGIARYEWQFGDGANSAAANPTHTYGSTGNYAVQLVVENPRGCRDTATGTVAIIPQPRADLLADKLIGCVQDMQVTLQDVEPAGLATGWAWDFGDGSQGSGRQVTHAYVQADTVEVRLVANHSQFCFDTAYQRIEIGSDVVSAFDLVVLGECSDEVEVLTDNLSQHANRYRWDLGDGSQSELFNPVVTYTFPDDYRIELIAYNDYFNCSDTSAQRVDYPSSEARFSFGNRRGCAPLLVQFQDSSEGASEWTWDFGDGSPLARTQHPRHLYTRSGTFQVTLRITFNGVCEDTFVSPIEVEVLPSPVADFTYTRYLDQPGLIQFYDSSTVPGDRYNWDFGDEQNSQDQNPLHQYETPLDVVVTMISRNNIGCADTVQDTLSTGAYGLFVPSAFMPDQDTTEAFSYFLPVGIGLSRYQLAVYDQWGNLVFQTSRLSAPLGRPNERWDGRIRGEPATSNVFIWRILEARYLNGAEYDGPREGTVTLIR